MFKLNFNITNMANLKLYFLCLLLAISSIQCMENGLLRTPPMGWMDWLKYAANIDCHNYPNECINEKLYKDMIDRIAQDGWLELGYNTVNIDDGWSEMKRDPLTNRLVPDRKRFPNGIKALVEYANAKNVSLGIYSDIGTKTCQGYPGTKAENYSADYIDLDAQTFSEWGVDSLKMDGCNNEIKDYSKDYPAFSKALRKQSHKIAFACSWPAYISPANLNETDYKAIQENCNYWRHLNDIDDSWTSVKYIIEEQRKYASTFVKYHGPGGWFDPDMLIIGNDGLSYEQSKTQMAFWCLWSAPLLMSNDLRTIKPEFKAILQNKHLIAVDQDPLGIMGQPVVSDKTKQVWTKKLAPLSNGLNPYVVLYFYNEYIGVPAIMSYQLSKLIPELKPNVKYEVRDLFADNTQIDTLTADQRLTLRVKTSGSVRMVKLVPVV